MKRIMAFLLFVLLAISVTGCNRASSNNHGAKFVGSWKLLSKESDDISPPIVPVEVNLIFFDKVEGIGTNFSQVSHTVDGGKEWIRVYDFYAQDISVYSFMLAGDQQVWGVGAKGVDERTRTPAVMRSKDRGKTWSQVEIDFGDEKKLSNESVSFVDICFTSPDKAWLATHAGLIEASVDESTIRIEKFFRTEEKLYSVSCSGTGRVVSVGKGAVYRYHDRGLSRLHPPSDFTFSKVKQIDNHIWLLGWKRLHANSNSVETGESGIVLVSADGGATWENRTPKQIRFFSDIHLRDQEGWLTGSDGNLFYSNDNGESWSEVEVPSKSHLYNIFFLDKRNIWIGGLNGTVLKFDPD
jgi:hypothetical protein